MRNRISSARRTWLLAKQKEQEVIEELQEVQSLHFDQENHGRLQTEGHKGGVSRPRPAKRNDGDTV